VGCQAEPFSTFGGGRVDAATPGPERAAEPGFVTLQALRRTARARATGPYAVLRAARLTSPMAT
jgi:hypothetical protein